MTTKTTRYACSVCNTEKPASAFPWIGGSRNKSCVLCCCFGGYPQHYRVDRFNFNKRLTRNRWVAPEIYNKHISRCGGTGSQSFQLENFRSVKKPRPMGIFDGQKLEDFEGFEGSLIEITNRKDASRFAKEIAEAVRTHRAARSAIRKLKGEVSEADDKAKAAEAARLAAEAARLAVKPGSDGVEVKAKLTQLYRHFDANDDLMYVGISFSAIARQADHAKGKGWYKDVARVSVENFDTREEAAAAEKKAIQTEHPRYNIVYAVAA